MNSAIEPYTQFVCRPCGVGRLAWWERLGGPPTARTCSRTPPKGLSLACGRTAKVGLHANLRSCRASLCVTHYCMSGVCVLHACVCMYVCVCVFCARVRVCVSESTCILGVLAGRLACVLVCVCVSACIFLGAPKVH